MVFKTICKFCAFNHGVLIVANREIDIGDDVIVGPYTVMRDSNHEYGDAETTINSQGYSEGNIKIGDDVWIGGHTVVLKNTHIGSHSIVAAQSLANKKIPEYQVWGGVPIKKLKNRRN